MDQVVFDGANVLYLVSMLPEGARERPVAGGWTIGQTVVHLGQTAEAYAAALSRMRKGEPLALDTIEVDPPAPTVGMFNSGESRIDEPSTFLVGREHFLGELELVNPTLLHAEYEGHPVKPMFVSWSRHSMHHGVGIVEALPEMWDDAIALTWVFEADLSYDADLYARQQALLPRVRAHLADLENAEQKGKKK